MIPAHFQSPCRPEQCEPFYDTRKDLTRRWRSLGKVFCEEFRSVPRSEKIDRKCDVTLYSEISLAMDKAVHSPL